MKLKPHLDAEAVVVGHHGGTGKYSGQVGVLRVEAPDGRRFLVGSGLTDALRRDPPVVGATITYRYRDLTSTGLPRFANYLRAFRRFEASPRGPGLRNRSPPDSARSRNRSC